MNPLILLIGIATLVFGMITLLKVRSAFVFLALCAGWLLAQVTTQGTLDFLQLFLRSYSEVTFSIAQLILLGLPVVVTAVLLRRTVAGANWATNFLPSILTACVAAYVSVPLLTPAIAADVMSSSVWNQIVTYETVLVGAAVFINLLQFWSSSRGLKHKKGKHGK